jgi:hypothetical protein
LSGELRKKQGLSVWPLSLFASFFATDAIANPLQSESIVANE